MLKISPDQMQSLGRDLERRRRDQSTSEIVSHLCKNAPDVMSRYTGEQHRQYVGEVLDASEKAGLTDPEQVLNWSYIRFLTGMAFYNMGEFKDILEHPLLHPDAKGRHIVLAFFAIQRMRQESQR